jgi:hypothetical protein
VLVLALAIVVESPGSMTVRLEPSDHRLQI